MNKFQAPRTVKLAPRRLPVCELRPGSVITLGPDSPQSRTLPDTVGKCEGGSLATVLEAHLYGDAIRVRADLDGRLLTFVVPAGQCVIVRMPETAPVPFTPLAYAVANGLPGALKAAEGSSVPLAYLPVREFLDIGQDRLRAVNPGFEFEPEQPLPVI